jgi:DinB superfamily
VTNEEIFAGIAVKTWNLVIGRLNQLISSLSDEEFQREVSPGRNRVYYIVGHLAAHHDRLLPLLGLGDRLHPELDEVFIVNPDRTFPDDLPAAGLRKAFTDVNAKLTQAIEALPAADLLKGHASVSEEDFAKDPLRNRLAVFEQRTAHAMFHAGQIRLVTKP